jgi:hypothetical protein
MQVSQVKVFAAFSVLLVLSGCKGVESQQQGVKTASSVQRPASPANAASGHVWHMKKAEVKTEIGWDAMPQFGIPAAPQRQVVAISMLIPVDWELVGGGVFSGPPDCNFNTGRLGFRATGPDKKMAITSFPLKDSVWSSDRSLLQSIEANNKQFPKMQSCKIEQPQPLAAKISELEKAFAPKAEIVSAMEPIPGLSQKLGPMVQQANAGLAQQAAQSGGMASHIAAEAGRIRVHLDKNGDSLEGWYSVLQVTRTDTLPNGATLITTDYPMQVATSAPQGKLDALEPMYTAMLDSVVLSPEYEQDAAQMGANFFKILQITKQRLGQIAANMAADNANAARQQQAIRMGVQNYAAQVHSNVAANRSAALENSSQQFAMHMGDQALYHDPSTGQNVQLSNQYGHAWASTSGNTNEYILTDSPSYNPNGQVGSGSWTQMQQVK